MPLLPNYAGYRFLAEIISHAVWLYFRFSLSLRNVDESLAARGSWLTTRATPPAPHGIGQGRAGPRCGASSRSRRGTGRARCG